MAEEWIAGQAAEGRTAAGEVGAGEVPAREVDARTAPAEARCRSVGSLKRRSREAFDAQAATYDDGMQGDHARMLYPHVEREVVRAAGDMFARTVGGRRACATGSGQARAVGDGRADTRSLRLLDMGCGTGALAERVLDALPGAAVSCLDLSPRMVEAAQVRLRGRAEVLAGDAEHLPYRDGEFDVVWCNDSFHHYPEPERATFQAWRVLKPGGAFVVGDVWQPAPARALMNAWMPRSREGDVRIYSEEELRAILRRWFDVVSWRRVGMTACLAVARKVG